MSVQIRSNFVPPILSTSAPNCMGRMLCRHLSRPAPDQVRHRRRRFVACQVLPDFTRTAAARFNCLATSRTHLPCSRLHARLAGCIAALAGRLLPYPFTPHQIASHGRTGGSPLCCGCSRRAVASSAPPLAVSWGNRIGHTDWESGSSSTDNCRQ